MIVQGYVIQDLLTNEYTVCPEPMKLEDVEFIKSILETDNKKVLIGSEITLYKTKRASNKVLELLNNVMIK